MAELLPWQVPVKLGVPFHGKVADGVVHLPNGSTQPWPYTLHAGYTPIKLQAPDAPAVTTTPEETAAGREWRNYLLYQAGGGDMYSEPGLSLVLNPALDGVKAVWLFMPKFGLTFRMRLVKTGDDYALYAKQVGLLHGGLGLGEVLAWSGTITAHHLFLVDVQDGPGDHLLWLTVDKTTADTLSVIEWVISRNAETGEFTLAESVIDGVASSSSSSATSARIRKYSYESVTTEIGSYTCNNGTTDITVPLHQTVRQPKLIPLTDPGNAAYESIVFNIGWRYIESTTYTAHSDTLIGALYQGGIAKSVREVVSTSNATNESVVRVIEGQSHEVAAAPCGSWDVVIDTPFKYDAMFVSTTANSTVTQLLVGGIVVAEGTATLDRHLEKYYADGYIEAVTAEATPIGGWDVNTSSSSDGSFDVSQIKAIHPMWTVNTGPGWACSILHTFGLTSGFDRLKTHSLDHASGGVSEEYSTQHSWV